jgi:hypothetical protein
MTRTFLSAFLALGAVGCGSSAPDSFVPIGTWGGDHASLIVTATNATIEFDCAHGALPAPITLTDGAFDMPGEYFQEYGGPIRVDETVDGQPARYRGSISRGTMTLRVSLTRSGQDVGTYSLTFGASGRVFKCL